MENEKENLVGRWLKALIDGPQCGAVKKGEIGEIVSMTYAEGDREIRGKADFPSQKNYHFTIDKNWELMPEGWSPEGETFKVGDRVSFKDEKTSGEGTIFSDGNGAVNPYLIKMDKPNGWCYNRTDGENNDGRFFNATSLTKLNSPVKEEIPPSKFNIGDIVDVDGTCYYMSNTTCSFDYLHEQTMYNSPREKKPIISKEYSIENSSWWYKLEENGNWRSERGMFLSTPKQETILNRGEYYTVITKHANIFISGGGNIVLKFLRGMDETFHPNRDHWVDLKTGKYRRATQDEIKWLDACIAANKFVPKEEALNPKNMFKKDEYIVVIKGDGGLGNHKSNHVYKQRMECAYIRPYLDSSGSRDNGNTAITYLDTRTWRMATSNEAMEYEKRGHPYDVKELEKPKAMFKNGDVVVCKEGYNSSSSADTDEKGGFGYQPNLCFKINYIDVYKPEGESVLWSIDSHAGGFHERCVRVATQEEKEFYEKKGGNYYITDIPKQEEKFVNDEELLEYANKNYCIGTFFRSTIVESDKERVREVKLYPGYKDINYTIHRNEKDVYVYASNGMCTTSVDGKEVCSNPYIYKNGVWCEIVPNPNKEEDLLEEAKERYPKGTSFYNAKSKDVQTTLSDAYYFSTDDKNKMAITSGYGWVYYDGNWAEIISPVFQGSEFILKQAKECYPKGTKFVDLVNNIEFVVKEEEYTFQSQGSTLYVSVEPSPHSFNKTARICNVNKGGLNNWARIISSGNNLDPWWRGLNVEQWCDRVKALNLSETELVNYVWTQNSANEVYEKLPGKDRFEKAKLLYNKWNSKGSINVGDWVEFHDKGGLCVGNNDDFKLHVPMQIMSMDIPFDSQGDCHAIFTGGMKIRMSSVGNFSEKHHYQKKFKKVNAPIMGFSGGMDKEYTIGIDPYRENPCMEVSNSVFNVAMLEKRKKELQKYVGVEHQSAILLNNKKRKQLLTI